MKSVLISIQPIWVEKIASGEKTIEVRKTRPKIEEPFKCYIYCTKDNAFAEKTLRGFDENGNAIYYKANKGKVIGEFVCDRIDRYYYTELIGANSYDEGYVCGEGYTCLNAEELWEYGKGADLFGWHISDLKIYDKPKELSEFCTVKEIGGYEEFKRIARPPQSWCYVEVEE